VDIQYVVQTWHLSTSTFKNFTERYFKLSSDKIGAMYLHGGHLIEEKQKG